MSAESYDQMFATYIYQKNVGVQWIEAHLAVLRQCKAMDAALVKRMKAGGDMAHPPEQEEQLRALVEAEEKAECAALVHCCTLLIAVETCIVLNNFRGLLKQARLFLPSTIMLGRSDPCAAC